MEALRKRHLDNTAPSSSAGLIIQQKEPKNLEAPFDRIDSYLTPTELFYIRSHFPTPDLAVPLIGCTSMVQSGVRLL